MSGRVIQQGEAPLQRSVFQAREAVGGDSVLAVLALGVDYAPSGSELRGMVGGGEDNSHNGQGAQRQHQEQEGLWKRPAMKHDDVGTPREQIDRVKDRKKEEVARWE